METVELAQMKEIPENFIAYYEAIVKAQSVEELKKLSYEIISTSRKFIAVHTLYIPSSIERKKWGHGSGARIFYKQRNEEIRNKFFHKASIDELAEEYCLSTETIRKIVYK